MNYSSLLIVGDESAILVPSSGTAGRSILLSHSNSDADAAPLLTEMMAYPGSPVVILANTSMLELRQIKIPPGLGRADRARLIARRIPEQFPETSLVLSVQYKDQAVLGCIKEDESIKTWLSRLEKLPVSSGRVGILPLESGGLISRLSPEGQNGWSMMLSLEATGGLRQTVTHDGYPVFTRLAPFSDPDASNSMIASLLTLDIWNTVEYLSRLGLRREGEMNLVAIIPESLHQPVQAINLPMRSVTMYSPYRAAEKAGMDEAPAMDDPYGTVLQALWARNSHKRIATAALPKAIAGEKLRFKTGLLRKAAIASWAAAALIILWQAIVLSTDWIAINKTGTRIAAAQAELDAEILPGNNGSSEILDKLRLAVERRRIFLEQHTLPWDAMNKLNEAIAGNGRLTKIEWSNTGKLKAMLAISSADDSAEAIDGIRNDLSISMPENSIVIADDNTYTMSAKNNESKERRFVIFIEKMRETQK